MTKRHSHNHAKALFSDLSRFIRRYAIEILAVVVACIAIAYLAGSRIEAMAIDFYEDVSYIVAPSGAKAFAFGERHFDGQNPSLYDISRATYFFQQAARLDPSLLYVHHELARISFLNGDFNGAMLEIDTQLKEHATSTPNSYYIRGLIEGYMGDYTNSAKDYKEFLQFDPRDWAAINDYAWVLMKGGNYEEAAKQTTLGLTYFPDNAWLLNSNAIALFETGHLSEAKQIAIRAQAAAATVTEAQWLHAYPGNDPSIAGDGIASLKKAAADNIHMIDAALATSTVQSK